MSDEFTPDEQPEETPRPDEPADQTPDPMANKPSDGPLGAGSEVTDDDKLWAMLSWIIWVIAVLALILEEKKDREYIRYHAWHSIVVGVLFTIISFATLGCGTPVFLVALYFAYQAYMGEWVKIPVVTDFLKQQGWI
jgi:uncharacterized membrane protein